MTTGDRVLFSLEEDTIESNNLEQDVYVSSELKISDGPTLLFGDDLIISLMYRKSGVVNIKAIYYTEPALPKVKEIIQEFKNLYEENPAEIISRVGIMYISQDSLRVKNYEITIPEVTLEQFNQDLPDQKIQKDLKDGKSGIFVFYGLPGTGKSTYIKYLISRNRDLRFIYVTQDILARCSDAFRSYILRSKRDTIFILEDCDNLLVSRTGGSSNPIVSDILNIGDGILGDITGSKFIFTFNTGLRNIDQALLRKGRCKCMYEFRPLSGERLKKLAEKLGVDLESKEMTVAELFFNKENSYKQERQRIGF